MTPLNLPSYQIRFKREDSRVFIFDIIRKKYLVLTPEEWVRQNIIHYLINEKRFSPNLIVVEQEIKVANTKKRIDIACYNKSGKIELLVECKAPEVRISQETFDQIARYNLSVNANKLMVTNGLNHYYAKLDYSSQKYIFLQDI